MESDSPNINELSFDEKIALLEEELPVSIRNFLQSPERDAISLRLSTKYKLHADQAGAFEQAYLYMLLGVNTPEDFVQDLKDAGIPLETIRGLTTDVNEQVFKKLQQQELHPIEASIVRTNTPTQPAVPVLKVTPAPPPSPPPVPEPPLVPPTPTYNLMRPDALVSAPQPVIRTMEKDVLALQHPEQVPAVQQSTMPPMPHPSQVTPARSFQTASVPYTSIPTPSRPVPPEPMAPHNSEPPPTPPASYGSDPYREPI
jgi:hypothetical protein